MSTDSKDIIPSKTFCTYPWTHSYQGSKYERKLCCIADDVPNGSKQTLDEFWNSEYMQTTRKKMLKGDMVKECAVCYKNEMLGIKSLREESNEKLVELQSQELLDSIIDTTTIDDGYFKLKPNYFDYRTIHCNLQCVSCGDVYSSQHQILKKEMWGDEPTFSPDKIFEANSAGEIIEAINSERLENLYWAGGEPMMSPLHWKVISYMDAKLNTSSHKDYISGIRMHYNTNLTRLKWKNKLIPEMLEPFQPSIQASLDGAYETCEYTRDGAVWSEVDYNFKEYHKLLNKNNQFGVATVLSAPVIFDIDRYLDYYGPYDPFIHPHYNFTNKDRNHLGGVAGFLDMTWYPKNISIPALKYAIKRFEECGLRNTEKAVQILNAYLDDINKQKEDTMLTWIRVKGITQYRDQFAKTKRSFSEVLGIIDNNTSNNLHIQDWYDSIEVPTENIERGDPYPHLNKLELPWVGKTITDKYLTRPEGDNE